LLLDYGKLCYSDNTEYCISNFYHDALTNKQSIDDFEVSRYKISFIFCGGATCSPLSDGQWEQRKSDKKGIHFLLCS